MVVVAMVWANTSYHDSYERFFQMPFIIGLESFALTELVHIWINDGLMPFSSFPYA